MSLFLGLSWIFCKCHCSQISQICFLLKLEFSAWLYLGKLSTHNAAFQTLIKVISTWAYMCSSVSFELVFNLSSRWCWILGKIRQFRVFSNLENMESRESSLIATMELVYYILTSLGLFNNFVTLLWEDGVCSFVVTRYEKTKGGLPFLLSRGYVMPTIFKLCALRWGIRIFPLTLFTQQVFEMILVETIQIIAVNTWPKLKVHKTFAWRSWCHTNALCTYNLSLLGFLLLL